MQKVYVETVLAVLDTQRGYFEKQSNEYLADFERNAGNKNFTKYANELDQIGYWNTGKSKKNGYEWCAPFCNWVVYVSSGRDVAKTKYVLCIPENEENLAAGCEYLRKYFRAAGRYDAKPKIGDLILFTTSNDGSNSADHVGFITDIGADGYIYTIEGNKDNKVCECKYPGDYWKILGFCHPRYDNFEVEKCDHEKEIISLKAKLEEMITLYSEASAKLDQVKSIVA